MIAIGLTAMLGSTLTAQAVFIGGQATASFGQGDFNGGQWLGSSKPGYGGGLRLPIDFENRNVIVPRVDVMSYKQRPLDIIQGDKSVMLYSEAADVRVMSFGVDYDLALGEQDTGFYILAGLGYSRGYFKNPVLRAGGLPYATPAPSQLIPNQNTGSGQYAVGVGWHLTRHLGVESRFTQSNFRGVGGGWTEVKAPAFNFSATCRF
jgi:hypothetical protein